MSEQDLRQRIVALEANLEIVRSSLEHEAKWRAETEDALVQIEQEMRSIIATDMRQKLTQWADAIAARLQP